MLRRPPLFVCLLCCVALAAGGCGKRTPKQAPVSERETKFDACALLQKGEIEATQGSPLKDVKSSQRLDGIFQVSQCFYTAAEFNKSVNLAVMRRNPAAGTKRSPKDFWEQTFRRHSDEEEREKKEKEKERGEEKEGRPPTKVEGVGEEAYWASNRFGGILYVLKGDSFISVSIGGADSEAVKIDKSKALAKKAIERL